VFPFWCVSFCVFPAGADQLNCLSRHTGVRYEAIKQVLGYKSAAAPPLMSGSIVADLWHQTCLEPLWLWLKRGHVRFVVGPVVGFVVGPSDYLLLGP